MKFSSQKIKAIIFDLGGVVLNLSPQKTFDAFGEITGLSQTELEVHGKNELFKNYETGKISSPDFRSGLRNIFQKKISDRLLDDAWNAMLLDLPLNRIEMIGALKSHYNTYVLSNTNEIHIEAFDEIVNNATSGKHITDYFHEVYYSHIVKMRKPDAEIFEMVIHNHSLDPSTTLFIDDTLEHIESAQKLGLQTWHLTDQKELLTAFKNE